MSALFAAYIKDRARLRAPKTVQGEASQLDAYLRWRTSMGIDEPLSLDALSAWFGSSPKLAVSTRRKRVEAVQRAWRWARQRGWDVPEPGELPMPAAPRRQTVAPTWAEMDACIGATLDEVQGAFQGFRQPNRGLYQRAVIARCTGLRIQQVMGLEWRDVDLRNGKLTIRPELGKTDEEKAGRVVPIAPVLIAELATWGRRVGHLVECHRTGKTVARVARQRDMVRAWQRSGVRSAAWHRQSHHAFRKGFVSGLIRLGAPREAVEYLVGHSQGIAGVYTDPTALGLREAVALVPEIGEAARGVVVELSREGGEGEG